MNMDDRLMRGYIYTFADDARGVMRLLASARSWVRVADDTSFGWIFGIRNSQEVCD